MTSRIAARAIVVLSIGCTSALLCVGCVLLDPPRRVSLRATDSTTGQAAPNAILLACDRDCADIIGEGDKDGKAFGTVFVKGGHYGGRGMNARKFHLRSLRVIVVSEGYRPVLLTRSQLKQALTEEAFYHLRGGRVNSREVVTIGLERIPSRTDSTGKGEP